MSGYGRTDLFTPPCVSFRATKNGRHKADLSSAAAIYAAQTEAVQPPDDRTYSAEVTVFRRNLLHHRSARAVFPYTRSIMIPQVPPFVKRNFRKNHLFSHYFLRFFMVFARAAMHKCAAPFPKHSRKIHCRFSPFSENPTHKGRKTRPLRFHFPLSSFHFNGGSKPPPYGIFRWRIVGVDAHIRP